MPMSIIFGRFSRISSIPFCSTSLATEQNSGKRFSCSSPNFSWIAFLHLAFPDIFPREKENGSR